MAKRKFTLAEVHEELFRSDDEQEAESDGSMPASMDSEEEEAFLHGIDSVFDIEAESSDPPPQPVSHTSEQRPGPSTDVPHTSAGGARSPTPPTEKRLPQSRRSSSERHPVTRASKRRLVSAGRQPSASSTRKRFTSKELRTALPSPPTAVENRWHGPEEEDEQPNPLQFRPRRTPGAQLDFQMDYSPSEIFQLFFSKEVIQTLCCNTNKYAARRSAQGAKRPWKDVSLDELLHFLSLVIYFGLMKPSAARDLWRKDCLHRHPFPPSVMGGYRYEAISVYLHMSDPAADVVNDQLRGQPGYDGLFRLKPLQDQILTACRAYYQPHQNISIDERVVATKARISMKQYMKDKPTKWGYKLFVLADSSNGYTCGFTIYEGKSRDPSGNGLSFDSAVNLLHVPSLGTGYTVYVDNFYTSSKLFRHLSTISFGACGTIRENRIGFPRTAVNALPRKAERGDMRWIRDGPLLFVKWRDTRDVTMCSTVHKAYSGQSVKSRVRNTAGTWSIKQIPVPDPFKDYNKFMGGVDLSDALIKYYAVVQKTRRWYKKLFLHFVDIAVVNSFIIHKELALIKQQKHLTQKHFREVLWMELAGVGRPPESPPSESTGEASTSAMPQVPQVPQVPGQRAQMCLPVPVCIISAEPHLKATQGRKHCAHCKMKTMYMCQSCGVPLCIAVDRLCFTEWHKQRRSSPH